MADSRAVPDRSGTRRKHRPHWYRMHIGECPICMSDKSYRERVYGERPNDPAERYVHIPDTQTYDWCEL